VSFRAKTIAVSLLLVVLAIVLAPACNLAPTAMRSVQMAMAVICGIAMAVAVLDSPLHLESSFPLRQDAVLFAAIRDIDCVRLC
jgi:hypothetical protein